jgi:hypothetical protein
MPKRIIGDPETGYPGTWDDNGKRIQGIYRYVAYVYGADEVPYVHAKSMAEQRAKYWDPSRQALVIPFTGGQTYEFGSKLLSQTTDATMVLIRVEFQFPHQGPPPRSAPVRRSRSAMPSRTTTLWSVATEQIGVCNGTIGDGSGIAIHSEQVI